MTHWDEMCNNQKYTSVERGSKTYVVEKHAMACQAFELFQ